MSILSGRGNSSQIQVASLDLLYILLYTDISLRLFLDFLAGLSLIYCYDYYYDYYYYSVGSFFFSCWKETGSAEHISEIIFHAEQISFDNGGFFLRILAGNGGRPIKRREKREKREKRETRERERKHRLLAKSYFRNHFCASWKWEEKIVALSSE